MAWKTADNVWHQRATMAHQFIIYGLPDSILMLCMHLDTPREAFAYLEYRYGQIPRPEIQKTVDEAVQQHDMPSEQYMTGESAQSTCNSDNGPENLPGGHEDPADSPNDCAETESGFLTPETKVADARHVEPYLLEVEVGDTGGMWPDEYTNALEAPDECSQRASNKVEEGNNLLELSSEALESQGDLPDTTSERAETQTGHRKPETEVVDTQQVVNVLPMVEVGTKGRARHNKHVKEHEAPDEGGQRADNKVEESRDLPKSSSEVLEPAGNPTRQAGKCSMEDVLQTPIEDYQHARTNGETIANIPDLPSTPTELPIPCIKCPTLQNRSLARKRSAMTTEFDLSYTRRSGKWRETKRLELDCKRTSRHPQQTHRGHSACKTPPDEARGMGVLSSPRAFWGDSTMAGSTATKLERRVVSAKTAEIQAYIPHLETHPKEPDKAEDTGGGGDDAASKDILDSRGVKKTSLANSGSQQGERKTRWRNSLPAPPETPPNGFIHPPRTLTDRYCHGRIKTDLQKLSTGQEMERRQGGSPVPPAPPPNGTYYIHKSSKGLRHRARLKSNAENKSQQAEGSMAVQNQSTWDDLHGKEDNSSEEHDDTTSSGCTDSRGVEESLLTDSGSQHSERNAKRAGGSPAPPAPRPNGTGHLPRPYQVPRRRGRLKLHAEGVSDVHTRQDTHHAHAAPMQSPLSLFGPMKWLRYPMGRYQTMKRGYNEVRRARQIEARGHTYQIARILMRLVQSLFAPTKWLKHPTGGYKMMKRSYNEVRRVRQVETRGGTYRTACILMQLLPFLSNPSKRLQNISNTYWWKGVPPGSTRNDATWPRNLCTAKRLPVSSDMRRDNEYRAKRPNDSPAPSKPARYDHLHPPWTLRDRLQRGRIRTKAGNVSRSEARGRKASILTIPIPPPRELARPLWNVANTYWRHGIPPGRT
ncbi:hypothetical protein EDD16DRAFT_1900916 [Pisolithus croceorrhizus]|nr:hypothetical protein EDD16DRAFT_1900916 [Pisolithus croceorrhizus]